MLDRRIIVLAAALCCACGGPPADSPEAREDEGPWRLVAYAGAEASPRVLVIHDMEGLAGQDDPASFSFGTARYVEGQELLAGDVNAVVEGLFAGGAGEVLVVDGHGSGSPEPDLRSDLLDPRATQIIRDEPFDTYFDLPESEAIDAVVVVGMHAKTGSEGFASHTFTLGIDLRLSEQSITETELVALSWGRVGVPLILASGDDRLAGDLSTMPWIEYVTVKEAIGADDARLRPLEETRRELREAAQRAIERLPEAVVMEASTPVRASLRAVPPASLEVLEGFPGIDYEDQVFSFVAADMREAYWGLVAAVNVARTGYVPILDEVVLARSDGEAIFEDFGAALTLRWFDQESGRLSVPASEAPEARRYHGYR